MNSCMLLPKVFDHEKCGSWILELTRFNPGTDSAYSSRTVPIQNLVIIVYPKYQEIHTSKYNHGQVHESRVGNMCQTEKIKFQHSQRIQHISGFLDGFWPTGDHSGTGGSRLECPGPGWSGG